MGGGNWYSIKKRFSYDFAIISTSLVLLSEYESKILSLYSMGYREGLM